MAGLGVTEAAGLTQVADFVATILRIKTPDGTLVVKVDDPTVKVQIDGDDGGHRGRWPAGNPAPRRQPPRSNDQGRQGRFATSWSRSPGVGRRSSTSTSSLPKRPWRSRCKNQPAVCTPRSHANQCMTCHANVRALKADEPLPSNHPPHRPCSRPLPRTHTKTPGRLHVGGPKPPSPGARAMIWSLAFSPDGRSLAIGQQAIDRPPSILRIWDLAQRRDTDLVSAPRRLSQCCLLVGRPKPGRGELRRDFVDVRTRRRMEDPPQRKPGIAHQFPGFSSPGTTTFAAGDWDGWVRFHGPDAEANAVHSGIRAGSGRSRSARMARCWPSVATRTRSRSMT